MIFHRSHAVLKLRQLITVVDELDIDMDIKY